MPSFDISAYFDSYTERYYASLFETMTDTDLARWIDNAAEQVVVLGKELPDDQKWFAQTWQKDVERGKKEWDRRQKRLFFLTNPSMTKETIQQIKTGTSIIDVLLFHGHKPRKIGRVYKMICPFHGDSQPSFTIWTNPDRYKCFGCDKHGDVFTLVQEFQGVDFVESVKFLAEQLGVEIEG